MKSTIYFIAIMVVVALFVIGYPASAFSFESPLSPLSPLSPIYLPVIQN